MARMPMRMRRYPRDAARAFERAPVEVLLAVVVAGAFSWALEIGDAAVESWAEVAVVAVLAGAAAWTGTLLHAMGAWSSRRRRLVTAIGLAAATAYGATLLRPEPESEGWRAIALVAAAAIWVVAVPVAARGRDAGAARFDDATRRLRRVGGRFLLRTAGAALYAVALFAGLALALRAVDRLFELGLRASMYGHLFGWLAFALVPWIVAGGVEDYARPEGHHAGAGADRGSAEGADRGPAVGADVRAAADAGSAAGSDAAGRAGTGVGATVHRLSAYLVVPLVAIYYLILYAYAVRIGVTGELPKNLVSPLVLAAGGLGAAALLLFDPRPGHPQPRRALRAIAPLFVPLGVLGIWAVALRVGQYGWTEFRYLRFAVLVALVALALAGTGQILRRRRLALHGIPLTLAAVLLLSAFGPWSALAVSRRSQQARLAAALEAADLSRDGRLAEPEALEPRTVPNPVYDDITSTVGYLNRHFGRESLRPVLPVDELDDAALRNLAAHYGLRRAESPRAPRVVRTRLATGTTIDGPGGATIRRVSFARGSTAAPDDRPRAPAGRVPPSARGGETPPEAAGRPDDSERIGADARGDTVVVTAQPGSMVLRLRTDGTDLSADLAPIARWVERPSGPPAQSPLPADLALVDVVDAAGERSGRLLILDLTMDRPDDRLEPLRMDGVLLLEPGGG
ncbi:MAG: DUF4153 domain-containing protein [Gemmatimonadota bacterium]